MTYDIEQMKARLQAELEALFALIFDPNPVEPTNEFQKRARSAHIVGGKLLSAGIYFVLLAALILFAFRILFPESHGEPTLPSTLNTTAQRLAPFLWKIIPGIILFLLSAAVGVIYGLRILLHIAKTVQSYRLFALIGISSTFFSLCQVLPALLQAHSISELARESARFAFKALGG